MSDLRKCRECQWMPLSGRFRKDGKDKGVCYFNPPRWIVSEFYEGDDRPVLDLDTPQCSCFAPTPDAEPGKGES